MNINRASLAELRAALDAADPGSWSVHREPNGSYTILTTHGGVIADGCDEADATAIVTAKNMARPMADEVVRLWGVDADRLAFIARRASDLEALESRNLELRQLLGEHDASLTAARSLATKAIDEGVELRAELEEAQRLRYHWPTLERREREVEALTAERDALRKDLDHVRLVLGEAREILVDGGAWGNQLLGDAARLVTAERDAYRAMLADLMAAQERRGPNQYQWNRARELLKNGPASKETGNG